MRAWYMDPLGFHADLCLMLNGTSTRLTVRSPEGTTIHRDYYPTWNDALAALQYMLPRCVNELTGDPIHAPYDYKAHQ